MAIVDRFFTQIAQEHRVLLHQHARLQARCSEQARAQAAELMRLRAELILLKTLLHWEREDRAKPVSAPARKAAALFSQDDLQLPSVRRSLLAVDLVICQTGCLSQGQYWREDEHCRRLCRTCIALTSPELLEGVVQRDSAEIDSSDSTASAVLAAGAAASTDAAPASAWPQATSALAVHSSNSMPNTP